MDVFEAIRTRRSIRRYSNKIVEEEKLTKTLEAARLAPSAHNYQQLAFVIVKDSRLKESLRSSYNHDWLINAPVIIVVCGFPEKAWVRDDGEEFWKVDAAIAMQTLILEAWNEGLGTCWIGDFDEVEAKKVLGIPSNVRILAMTPLGYPAENKGVVIDRRPIEEIIHREKW